MGALKEPGAEEQKLPSIDLCRMRATGAEVLTLVPYGPQLHGKVPIHPVQIVGPHLVGATSTRPAGAARRVDDRLEELVAQQESEAQYGLVGLVLLLDLLLDSIVLELVRQRLPEALGDRVEPPRRLVGVDVDELRHHQVAERPDIIVVREPGHDSLVEVDDVDA